jgi:hypothetical protein
MVAAALLIAVVASVATFSSGCTKKPPTGSGTPTPATREGVTTALAGLESQQDLGHCRTALQQLDNLESTGARPALAPNERGDLAALFRFTKTEEGEISQPTFSQTDAAYLEECLFVRAGVRSLKIDKRPPLERARVGFDWVCRMVYVDDRVTWAASPWMTLQTGSGVALSRAYVVLAAWQQLGLNGCLIGPPALKTEWSCKQDIPGTPQAFVPGVPVHYAPVRACGLKVGTDVFLFDHTSGRAIPSADGKGVLTLAQAKATPERVKALASADEVKNWQPFLAPTLSCMARRMEWLEQLNPANSGANLFVDIKALRHEFARDLPDQPIDGWNPEGDAHTATRVLGRYAAEEAKFSQGSILGRHRVAIVPLENIPKTALTGQAETQIKVLYLQHFEFLRYGWGSARDSLVRGLFSEVTGVLERMKTDFENAGTRFDQDKELRKDFDAWAEEFQSLSAAIIRARERDPASLPAAEAKMTEFLADRKKVDIQRAFVRGTAARPLVAEVTYLMASAVHERGERAQLDGSERAAGLWRNTFDWWERFLDASARAHSALPAREAHGRALKARCEQFISK